MTRFRTAVLPLLFLLPFVVAHAQTPSLEVTPAAISFGCTLGGEDSSRTFRVRNVGSSDVIILEYVTTRSDFVPPATRDYRLAAGASVDEVVRFQPLTAGPASPSGSLVVRTADGELSVPLSGEVGAEPMIGVNPTRLDFGDVSIGSSLELCITVSNPSCREIEVLDATTSDAAFTITRGGFPAPRTLGPFAEETLCVTFTPTVGGDRQAQLTLRGELGKRSIVQLFGRGVRSELAVEPQLVNFGAIDVGTLSPIVTVEIVNRGTKLATIAPALALSGTNPGDFAIISPTIPIDVGPGERVPVRLRFQPSAAGRREARIVVENSSDVDPVIRLEGFGSTFDAAIAPTEVDMGDVYVGRTRLAPDTVIVSNRSTRSITVTATIEGADRDVFSVFGFVITPIAARVSYAYGIEFRPYAPRVFRAELVITFDNGTTFRVPLRGRGLDTAAPRPRRITGDSMRARVGERAMLRFTIDPPLGPPDTAQRVRLWLRLDPRALYPHRVIAEGATAMRSYTGSGEVEVTISHSDALPLAHFDLEIEGLFTGRPINIVGIDSVDLGDPRISATVTPGVVALEGCDIVRGDTLLRAARILSIAPNPSEGRAVLAYASPSPAEARVFSSDGRLVARLPIVRAERGEVELILDGLGLGTYIVELSAPEGSDRHVLRIVR